MTRIRSLILLLPIVLVSILYWDFWRMRTVSLEMLSNQSWLKSSDRPGTIYRTMQMNNIPDKDFDTIELHNPNVGVYPQFGQQELNNKVEEEVPIYRDIDEARKNVKKTNIICKNITDATTLWKSQPTLKSKFTQDADFSNLRAATICGGTLYKEFIKVPPRSKLYPFETYYLRESPLFNKSSLTSPEHSTIKLLGSSNLTVGDQIFFIIEVYDGEGKPRLKGGDRFKVWLKDVKFDHSISAKITDFDNGTYLVSSILPWVGTLRLMAILMYPREYIRAVISSFRALKSTATFMGIYKNLNASEGVPCSAFPIVPGYNRTEICNLTSINETPWYCGHPSKRDLRCSDYSEIKPIWKHLHAFATQAEEELLYMDLTKKAYLKGNISVNVEPTKEGDTQIKDPDLPCNKVPPQHTWKQALPTGYVYNNSWNLFLCHINKTTDTSCFKNVTIILYGDSNSRVFYNAVAKWSHCTDTGSEPIRVCKNTADKFTVKYVPHSSPLHPFGGTTWNYTWAMPPTRLFNSMSTTERYILSFNHYLHYTYWHISVYEKVMVTVKDALLKLLKRHPQVQVILRVAPDHLTTPSIKRRKFGSLNAPVNKSRTKLYCLISATRFWITQRYTSCTGCTISHLPQVKPLCKTCKFISFLVTNVYNYQHRVAYVKGSYKK